eukprot:92272_1
MISLILAILFHTSHTSDIQMPLPFTRELKITNPVMKGNDVLIATTLMSRCPAWPSNVVPSLEYTTAISLAVKQFQIDSQLSLNGVFDANTANITLSNYSCDKYVDYGVIKAKDYNVLYKIFIPVYSDSQRNVETMGQLFDADNNLLLEFKTRTHGQSNPPTSVWPNYNNSAGLNEFTSNGNTPTGLSYIDLNSPEPKNMENLYGPYPVHRVISGIEYKNITSNMVLLLQPDNTNIRSGILLHTGEWPGWSDGDQMPNSDGCIHVYPDDLDKINNILINQLGVVVRNNTFSSKNYPYSPQGIISVQQI